MHHRPPVLAGLLAAAALLLGACSSNAGSGVTDPVNPDGVGAATGAVGEVAYADLGVADADLSFDLDDAIDISLADGASFGGTGVNIDGDTVTLTRAGTYRVTGTLTAGSLVVDAPDATVNLVLDGVDITAASVAALEVDDADQVVVWLAEGSSNALADASNAIVDESLEDAPNATLFSTADLWIAGEGTLTVTAHAADGITSKDSLAIVDGVISVVATDDGIRGKDHLVISGGNLTVESGGDSLRSDNESVVDDPSATVGVIWIDGGTLNLTSGSDAIDASRQVTVEAGDLTISAGDDGLHSDEVLRISGGTVDIVQSYEGIEAAYMYLSGGVVNVTAIDDGINVAGGSFTSTITVTDGGVEPIPGAEPGIGGRPARPAPQAPGAGQEVGVPLEGQAPGGMGQFAATEPVQDLSSVTISPLVGGGFGGPPEGANGSRILELTGGTYVIDADSDGVDVNGAMTMTGGTLVISGTSDQRNGALDVDDDFIVTGGTLAANGMAAMAVGPDESSTQAFLAVTFSGSLPEGAVITLADSNGQVIASFTTEKESQSFIYSSDRLVSGEAYAVTVGGDASGDALEWLIREGTATGGYTVGTMTAQ